MSPNPFRPPTITFHPSIFPLFLLPSSLPVHCGGRRRFAFVALEGKVRPSPLLCLLLSFLSSVPPPPPPLYPSPYLCSSYCLPLLPLTYSNWSGAEWSEERRRAELTHDSELLTLQLREPSAAGRPLAWQSSHSALLIITLEPPRSFASGRKTEATAYY